jgi:hypothetical protein
VRRAVGGSSAAIWVNRRPNTSRCPEMGSGISMLLDVLCARADARAGPRPSRLLNPAIPIGVPTHLGTVGGSIRASCVSREIWPRSAISPGPFQLLQGRFEAPGERPNGLRRPPDALHKQSSDQRSRICLHFRAKPDLRDIPLELTYSGRRASTKSSPLEPKRADDLSCRTMILSAERM